MEPGAHSDRGVTSIKHIPLTPILHSDRRESNVHSSIGCCFSGVPFKSAKNTVLSKNIIMQRFTESEVILLQANKPGCVK